MGNPASVARLPGFPRVASVLAFVVATLVLIGWMGNLGLLTRGGPGLVAMNPMTAVLFLCAALSLWLQADAGAAAGPRRFQPLARLAALVVVVVALLRILGYASGSDFGVDQWLFAERVAAAGGPLPNRMAPNTAAGFVLLGLALLLLDRTTRRGRRPAEILAVMVTLVALLALFGYAYGVRQLYGVASYIPMALPTALVFLLLAAAVLYTRPGSGMMAVFTRASAGGAIARRLLPTMVGSMFVLGWLRLEGEHRGMYGAELGVALYTLANIAIFSALVWWTAIAIDRSDARRRAVEAERERFFAVTSDLLCVAGFDGYFKSLNPAWEDLLGYPRDELLARPFLDLVHPDDRAETAARMAVLADGTPVVGFENRYCRRDGDYRWFSWNATPVAGERQIYASARDITARKQAEEVQARMAAIVEYSDDAIISKTLEGTITTWNPAAEKLFGYSAAEAIGRPMAMLIPPERDGEEAGILAGIRRGHAQRFESVRMGKDGRRIHVAASISPIRDRAGAIVGASKVARDITERKRAEDSIIALNAELEANAAQLEQANRELEAFSYTISHDLRAPLRHIDGYARMLQEDAAQLDPESRRYLDAISGSARTMGMLIDDLLAFSRLGRKPVDRVRVDMIQLARRAMLEAGMQASESSIVFGELPDAHGDPVLLKQVWVNLLSNAVKYSAPRGAAARIEVSGERDGGVIRYRVRDNGVGFDMRYADKLFGVFQRLHSQDEFEGTGVGLAIVQRIVARHGGRIWAESRPGQGATFTIELPPAESRETEDIA